MYDKIEKLFHDFYKIYYKLEQLNLDSTIRCLTQNEIHIINIIGDSEMTMNELCEKLETTLGTTSIAINKLEKKKFVKRIKSKEDKRKVYVSLTIKGDIAYKYHGNFHKNIIKKATKDMDEKSLQQFFEIFSQIKNNLDEMKKEYNLIDLTKLEVGEVAYIEEVKLSHAALKYLYEKGIIQGREIKILQKEKLSIKLETIKGIKNITLEDAQGVFCIKKGTK